MFFIAAAVYFTKKSDLFKADSCNSYINIGIAAVALGLAISSKWVGVATLIWAGLICVWRLWFMVGNLSMPVCGSFKVALIKAFTLIFLPIILYILTFYFHFQYTGINSDVSQLFTPEFRTTLANNSVVNNVVAEIAVGSMITLRHPGTHGGYLHSHDAFYEKGSNQQQITCYPYVDKNDNWTVELYDVPLENITSFQNLTDGTKIRLLHNTGCRLHSHDHKPPVSENSDWQKEVSCYGYPGFEGDANDDWIIEIDKDASIPGESQEHVRAIETKFRLKHAIMGCYLFSHNTMLPKLGFEQQEVTCAYSGIDSLTLWSVENNENPFVSDDAERVSYEPLSFWKKFVETHKRMLEIASGMDNTHMYESKPATWPFMLRGIDFWSEQHQDIYLLGNAVLWWSVTAFIVGFAGIVVWELVSLQLGYEFSKDPHVINFHIQVIQYLLGFLLNFIPSLLLENQIFLYHYLPAYYFGILALTHGLDILVSYIFRRRRSIGYTIVFLFATLCVYFFRDRSALVYGTSWTKDLCEQSKWLSGWDYDCDSFLATYEAYAHQPSGIYTVNTLVAPSKTMEALLPPTVYTEKVHEDIPKEVYQDVQEDSYEDAQHEVYENAQEEIQGNDQQEMYETPQQEVNEDTQGNANEVPQEVNEENQGNANEVQQKAPQGAQSEGNEETHEYKKKQIDSPSDFDKLMNNPIPKKFVDENGNEIDPEVARKLIEEEGGILEKLH